MTGEQALALIEKLERAYGQVLETDRRAEYLRQLRGLSYERGHRAVEEAIRRYEQLPPIAGIYRCARDLPAHVEAPLRMRPYTEGRTRPWHLSPEATRALATQDHLLSLDDEDYWEWIVMHREAIEARIVPF